MPSETDNVVRADRRKKVGLTAAQELRLRSEADASGLSESRYIIKVLSDAWRVADARTGSGSRAVVLADRPITVPITDLRRRVSFTLDELAVIQANARACGMTEARYLHDLVVSAWGRAKPPKPTRNAGQLELAAQMNRLAYQVGKLGTNVNQLAKQANAGMVQVSRSEVQYLLNQQQLLLSKVAAAVEAVLA